VSKKVAIGGGTVAVIFEIVSSETILEPLGMAETNPNAKAPHLMAMSASAGDLTQHIVILGRVCMGCIEAV
jgi:hypothetical protein